MRDTPVTAAVSFSALSGAELGAQQLVDALRLGLVGRGRRGARDDDHELPSSGMSSSRLAASSAKRARDDLLVQSS